MTISLFNYWHVLNAATEWSSWHKLDVSLVGSVAQTDVKESITLEDIGIGFIFPIESKAMGGSLGVGENTPSVGNVVDLGRVEKILMA